MSYMLEKSKIISAGFVILTLLSYTFNQNTLHMTFKLPLPLFMTIRTSMKEKVG